MSGYYNSATICINGHAVSSSKANYQDFCKKCGGNTISQCPSCNSPVHGTYNSPGVAVIGFRYNIPSYCHACGRPYPWTEKLIENAIEIISLDESLSEKDKETIKLALPDLIVETPSSPVAVAKYKSLIPKATSHIKDAMRNLLIDVVSESIKKSIWG